MEAIGLHLTRTKEVRLAFANGAVELPRMALPVVSGFLT